MTFGPGRSCVAVICRSTQPGLLGILNFSQIYSSLRSTDLLQHLCTLNPHWGFTNQGLLGGLSSFLHGTVLPFGSWNVTPAWLVHRSPMAGLRTCPVLHLPFGSWNVTARLVHRSAMAELRTCPVLRQVCQIRSAPLLRASRYCPVMKLVIHDRNSKDVWIGSVHSFRLVSSWSVHLMW